MTKREAEALAKELEAEGYPYVSLERQKFPDNDGHYDYIVDFVDLAGEQGFHINRDRAWPQYEGGPGYR